MRVRDAIACAVLGAGLAGWAGAQDASAPLSESKQQLKNLRKDRAAQQSGANSGNLRDALPIAGAVPQLESRPEPPPRAPDRGENRKRQDKAGQNWLLDGVNELSRSKGDRTRTGTAKNRASDSDQEAEADGQALDPSAPDYFLRVYERERAALLARREEERAAAQGESGSAGSASALEQNNVMAPFLDRWLAGSPVKEIARDSAIASRRDSSPVSGLVGAGEPREAPRGEKTAALNLPDSNSSPGATPNRTDSNPFLQALGLPGVGGSGPSASPSTNATVLPPPLPMPRAADAAALPLPAPDTPRRPPNVTDESRKYFPQLKKF